MPYARNPVPCFYMGFFDQMKMAQEMMKNLSPEQIRQLASQAQNAQQTMDEHIRAALDDEIKKRGLITRAEVEQLLKDRGLS